MPKLVRKHTKEDVALVNARRIAQFAAEHKARAIRAFDVRELTVVADVFLFCTATSEPQMKAVYSAVKRGMSELGVKAAHTEGTASSGWMLLDFGTVIIHIFREAAREFYDLDGLWGDAPEVDLRLEE